jgi:predicted RND superfamily exporter protein
LEKINFKNNNDQFVKVSLPLPEDQKFISDKDYKIINYNVKRKKKKFKEKIGKILNKIKKNNFNFIFNFFLKNTNNQWEETGIKIISCD